MAQMTIDLEGLPDSVAAAILEISTKNDDTRFFADTNVLV
jgi:hypothetical protein